MTDLTTLLPCITRKLHLNSLRVSFNPEGITFQWQSKMMIALTNKLFLLSKIGNLVSYGNSEFCNLSLTRSKPFLWTNTLKSICL